MYIRSSCCHLPTSAMYDGALSIPHTTYTQVLRKKLFLETIMALPTACGTSNKIRLQQILVLRRTVVEQKIKLKHDIFRHRRPMNRGKTLPLARDADSAFYFSSSYFRQCTLHLHRYKGCCLGVDFARGLWRYCQQTCGTETKATGKLENHIKIIEHSAPHP